MKWLLFVLFMLMPSVVDAQDPIPELRVVVNADTARGWARGDTLQVQTDLGDKIRIDFYAVSWPVVNGYFMEVKHSGRFPIADRPDLIMPLDSLQYEPGTFLTGPDLPTTQDGLIILNNTRFQMGLTSLGEREDMGEGFLGTLSFQVVKVFQDTLEIFWDRFVLQSRTDSTGVYSPRGNPAEIKLWLTNLPPPAEPITSDFNKNGTVDFEDFIIFARVFGSIQGRDDNYNADNDLVLDGKIDFSDFLLFAGHFGKPAVVIR